MSITPEKLYSIPSHLYPIQSPDVLIYINFTYYTSSCHLLHACSAATMPAQITIGITTFMPIQPRYNNPITAKLYIFNSQQNTPFTTMCLIQESQLYYHIEDKRRPPNKCICKCSTSCPESRPWLITIRNPDSLKPTKAAMSFATDNICPKITS